MSSETFQISPSDAILRIKKLIEQNQGDKGRLEYIVEALQKGKKLFHSDQIYLNTKISANVLLPPTEVPSEFDEKLKNVKRLISLNFGDPERLRYMFQRLQKNKELYNSDEKYLESKTEQILKIQQRKNRNQRADSIIPSSLDRKINNEILTKLNSGKLIKKQPDKSLSEDVFKRLEESITQKSSLESKDKSKFIVRYEKDLNYNSEIENERENISNLKLEDNQIKIQRNELSQLITYRQEYEMKINHEKGILERETKIAQEEVKNKDLLVEELISNQANLIQIKTEREVLIDQMKFYKENAEKELERKQNELEELKIEYQNLQQGRDSTIPIQNIQTSDEDFNKSKKGNLKKSLKGKLEISIVAIGMIIGFSAVMMKLTEFWPCDILDILNINFPLC